MSDPNANPGHVYAGQPDGRQSTDPQMPTSRFRPRYRALSDDEKKIHDEFKAQAVVLEQMIERLNGGKPSRYKSLALTDLETSIMWAVKLTA